MNEIRLTKHQEQLCMGRVNLMIKSGHTDEDILWMMSKYSRRKVQEWIDVCRKVKQHSEN